MANVISFLFGTIALVLAIIGFIPLLGWLNWLIILIAGVGAAFGAASDKNSGRNFCFVVMGICTLASLLAIHAAIKVDPAEAIGG